MSFLMDPWGRQEGDLVIFSEIYKSVPGLPRFDGKSIVHAVVGIYPSV